MRFLSSRGSVTCKSRMQLLLLPSSSCSRWNACAKPSPYIGVRSTSKIPRSEYTRSSSSAVCRLSIHRSRWSSLKECNDVPSSADLGMLVIVIDRLRSTGQRADVAYFIVVHQPQSDGRFVNAIARFGSSITTIQRLLARTND